MQRNISKIRGPLMHKKINTLLFFLATAFLVGACSPLSNRGPSPDHTTETEIEPTQSGMADMGVDSTLSSQDFAPLVAGIYEGGEVLFIHPEASDPEVPSMAPARWGGRGRRSRMPPTGRPSMPLASISRIPACLASRICAWRSSQAAARSAYN